MVIEHIELQELMQRAYDLAKNKTPIIISFCKLPGFIRRECIGTTECDAMNEFMAGWEEATKRPLYTVEISYKKLVEKYLYKKDPIAVARRIYALATVDSIMNE